MIHIEDKRNCVSCANCIQVCPVGCIEFRCDSEGFRYPYGDANKCIGCSKCHDVCPVEQHGYLGGNSFVTKAYGAINKNAEIRRQSSSGGLFSAFASEIINRNGIVYGASIIDKKVKHISVSNQVDMYKLRRSKYVQSDILGLFPNIKQTISLDRPVLFSGTPCQIKALYCYLGCRPHNLLTIEVVCHGVPSPTVYERYLNELGADYMIFRNKDRSWSNYDVEIHYPDESYKIEKASENLYMRGFLHNWFLRPSCSRCPAKSFLSGADITLGDFWGGQKLAPQLFDDKGTSVVFLHSSKGEVYWKRIINQIEYQDVPVDDAKKGNSCISYSVVVPSNRDLFFKDLYHSNLLDVLRYYLNREQFRQSRINTFCTIIRRLYLRVINLFRQDLISIFIVYLLLFVLF